MQLDVEQVVQHQANSTFSRSTTTIGADAARTLDEHEIARAAPSAAARSAASALVGTWMTAAASMPAARAASASALRGVAADGDQQIEAGSRGGAAALFVQRDPRGAPSSSISPSTAILRALPVDAATVSSDFLSAAGLEL